MEIQQFDLTAEARVTLAEAAASRHDWLGEAGRPNWRVIRGNYRRRADYHVLVHQISDVPWLRQHSDAAKVGGEP